MRENSRLGAAGAALLLPNPALPCSAPQGSSWGLPWEMIVGKWICLLPWNGNSCIV